MENPYRVVWERYVESWKAESPAEKRALFTRSSRALHALFTRCLALECVYTDPLSRRRGWDEVLTYMHEFTRKRPAGTS